MMDDRDCLHCRHWGGARLLDTVSGHGMCMEPGSYDRATEMNGGEGSWLFTKPGYSCEWFGEYSPFTVGEDGSRGIDVGFMNLVAEASELGLGASDGDCEGAIEEALTRIIERWEPVFESMAEEA